VAGHVFGALGLTWATEMNRSLSIVLGAVLVAGAVLMTGGGNKARYQIAYSDALLLFRLDTFTGKISACMMNPDGYRALPGGVRAGDERFVLTCGDPSVGAH